jgi:hypothetical protein
VDGKFAFYREEGAKKGLAVTIEQLYDRAKTSAELLYERGKESLQSPHLGETVFAAGAVGLAIATRGKLSVSATELAEVGQTVAARGEFLSGVEKFSKPMAALKEMGEAVVTEIETSTGKTQRFFAAADSSRAPQTVAENTNLFHVSSFEPQGAASAQAFVKDPEPYEAWLARAERSRRVVDQTTRMQEANIAKSPLADPATIRQLVEPLVPTLKQIQALQLAGQDSLSWTGQLGHIVKPGLNRLGINGHIFTGELGGGDPISLGEHLRGMETGFGALVRLPVSKLKDPQFPLHRLGGSLVHEITHCEQLQFRRNAKNVNAAGLTQPEWLRAKRLNLSMEENTSAVERLEKSSSTLSRFQAEVATLLSSPSTIPDKLLGYESDQNRQALTNLFGVDSLPSEIRTWAGGQHGQTEASLANIKGYLYQVHNSLRKSYKVAFIQYQDLYHEREARSVQSLAEHELKQLLNE